MKSFYTFLIALMLIAAPMAANAQLTVPQGGTGRTSFTEGYLLYGGASSLRLDSESALFYDAGTNSLTTGTTTADYFCLTGDTCIATWPSAESFDATAQDALTWSDGANASNVWTFDLSGTDTTLTLGSDLFTFSGSLTLATGKNFTIGSTAWNVGDSINGEQIADDTIDDDSIDFGDVTLADLTFDVGSVSTTEYGYLDGVTSAIQTQLNGKQASDAFLDDIAALTDPGADRILFWDDSDGDIEWLSAGTGLSISGNTLSNTVTDTNTNAATICSGSTTYLDGEGNCDDISSVYLTGITGESLSDLSDVDGSPSTNDLLIWDGNSWANIATSSLGIAGETLTEEEIEDFVGGMLGGTETGISVTYQDSTNDIDFVISDAYVEDLAGGLFTGNTETLITATYQGADNTLDLVVDNNLANYSNASSLFFDSAGTGLSSSGSTANLDIDELSNRTAFTSGDKIAIFEAGVGVRKIDYDDLPGAGGGLTSLNGETGSTQTFSTSTSDHAEIHIDSSGNEHTFTAAVESGYEIPLTASTTEWDTAFSWGDHASVGYLDSSDIGSSVQAYDADLTTYAGITPSANVQSILSGANYAAIRTLLDLEAGTDFYSISAADAAFEDELVNSAGLRAALSDETGTGIAYFVGGALGTPASGNASNLSALNATQLTSGTIPAARVGTNHIDTITEIAAALKDGTGACSSGLLCLGGHTHAISSEISGLGTGIATALGVNVGSAGAPVLLNGALGTPSSGVGTALTALNGENIQDDSIDDDSIDFTDVTLADLTFDVGSVSTTEFGYLDGVTSAIQTQLNSKLEDITSESIESLSDVASMTQSTGDLLYWTGSNWSNIATSSLGIEGGGGGGGGDYTVTEKTTDYTLTSGDSGGVFFNDSGSDVDWTLPSAAAGLNFFIIELNDSTSNERTITPAGGDTIFLNHSQRTESSIKLCGSSSGVPFVAATQLIAVDDTKWIVMAATPSDYETGSESGWVSGSTSCGGP